MDAGIWLVFTLAVPLASSTAGATTHVPDTTTTALLATADTTTTALLPTADPTTTALLATADTTTTALLPTADPTTTALVPTADTTTTALLPTADTTTTALLPTADPSTTAHSITTTTTEGTTADEVTNVTEEGSTLITITTSPPPHSTITDPTDSTTHPMTEQTSTTYYTPTTSVATTTTTTTPYTSTALPSTDTTIIDTTFYPTTGEDITTYDTPPTTTTIGTTTTTPYTSTTLPSTNTTVTNTTFYPTTAEITYPTATPTLTSTAPSTTPTITTTTTTPSPTTITPGTTTALKCENGGENVNGVCICPDEWTGQTCSVENFCRAQQLGGFIFPQTPIGWFAYSEQLCEAGTAGAGKPKASTRCLSNSGSPAFNRPQIFYCDLTLSDIQNLTSAADLETAAASTQILTSKPEELTAANITAAAQITNTLLLSPNATESVRVSAVATVSQLLNATVPDDAAENNATQGLTLPLDQLSVNLSLSVNASESQVVQPNLVVQSAQVPAADTQGVQFTSLRGTSGSFVADRIQLNTNTTQLEVENGFIADALIYVQFPPGEGVRGRQTNSDVSLGFVLYQNDRFFPSKLYRKQSATIRVLSASVRGGERTVVPQHVEMLFRPRLMDGTSLHDFSCVFWSYALKEWSTAGCSKGNGSDGLMRCFCNHTTNFAALWSYRENYEYAEALDVISIVGLSLSILGLTVTIIYHLKEMFDKKDTIKAQLFICLSLLAFIITFVTGVQNRQPEVQTDDRTNDLLDSDKHVEPDRGSCTAVAALLHVLLMATFMWNGLYATHWFLVSAMHRSLPAHWTLLSMALGWGVPACLMAITLGVTYKVDDPLGYRQEEFCWLAALDKNKRFSFDKPMFWGFLLPVGLVLIYIMALLLVSCFLRKKDSSSSFGKIFWENLLLALLLGVSWVFGYLVLVSSGTAHLAFSILFCVFTTTQGLQIFMVTATPALRSAMSRSLQYLSSVSISLNNMKYRLWEDWNESHSDKFIDLSEEVKTSC
ncbi:adhesion G-protein coupled receptor G7-like [Archocentrus centrarchus]|uniref:adhesion G-protein coupled receptor G7-like n=1 Tax=Archocentrus centrarchus TaxID=63155 RepID=UPI0011E9DF6F|nr:adhesion G-protein coupled receptor G7-like [Archocentrus centrarchus]